MKLIEVMCFLNGLSLLALIFIRTPLKMARIETNTNQALAIIRLLENINNKYIFYILKSNHMTKYIEMNVKGSAQPNLNLQQLNDFKIPIPSLEEQERIVNILDQFDALVNDIKTGLPAEIKARRAQYEYYRKKLLTFNRVN